MISTAKILKHIHRRHVDLRVDLRRGARQQQIEHEVFVRENPERWARILEQFTVTEEEAA